MIYNLTRLLPEHWAIVNLLRYLTFRSACACLTALVVSFWLGPKLIRWLKSVQHQGQPIRRAITRRLRAAGISGVTTLRGVWGFHGDHRPHGDRVLSAPRRVPAVTIVIDAPERVAAQE